MTMMIACGTTPEETAKLRWFIDGVKESIKALDSKIDICEWPNAPDPQAVTFILVWNHVPGIWQNYPNLKCIASLGAGVDHILKDKTLPSHVPIVRVIDPFMAQDMMHYLVAATLYYVKRFDVHSENQKIKNWKKQPPFTLSDKPVGIMGLGYLGKKTAETLALLGLKVNGWSSTPKNIDGVTCYAGEQQFPDFLSNTHILICLLPSTLQTGNILNKNTFVLLPKGSHVINASRGRLLNDDDLLAALNNGHLDGATLDVFRHEPLPEDHPFWTHPKIRVTPHIASVTNAKTIAPSLVDNYHRVMNKQPLQGVVDIARGY